MRKSAIYNKASWILSIFISIFIFMIFLSDSDVKAEEILPFDTITATNVRFEISENSFYQEQTDTYIIGPGGFVRFYVTIEERIHRSSLGYGSEFSSVLTPDNAGYLNIEQFLLTNFNHKYFYKKHPTNPEREILYQSSGVNLDRLGRLPKFYYINERYPKVATILPGYEEIYDEQGISKGANVDKFVISIAEDPVLFSSDFEIKYRFQAGEYEEETDWTVCNDMNFINVPENKRNTTMNLFLETRDKLGRYYPSSYSWGAKGTNLVNRIFMSSDKVIEGGELLDFYINTGDKNLYELCRNNFKAQEEIHEEPKNKFDRPIAVFLNGYPYSMMSGYTGTVEDIDIEYCGYQWSKNPKGPDLERPFIPFDRYHKAVENHSYYDIPIEGYWCEITNLGEDLEEDGTYYLYVRAQDKVTGGVDWFPVIYNGNKYVYVVDNFEITEDQVELIKDSTPLEINITNPQFHNVDYDINIEVKDNYKLYAAQYHICDIPSCTPENRTCEEDWVDIELSQNKSTANISINTKDIKDKSLNIMENFTVHVRAVEARHIKYDNPFEDEKHIVSKSMRFYVPRALYRPVIDIGLFEEIENSGELKAAEEYKIYLFGKPKGIYDEVNDRYYEEKNVIGDIFYSLTSVEEDEPQWTRLTGNELILKAENYIDMYTTGSAITAEYILKAKVEDTWNNLESEEIEYKISFTNKTDEEKPTVNAFLSTDSLTNENIDITLESSIPISVKAVDNIDDSTIYELNEYKASHTFEISNNGHYIINYKTQEGYSNKRDLLIANIDKYFSTALYGYAQGEIVYLPQNITKDEVTAHLFIGERALPKDDGTTYYNGWINYVFEDNGNHQFNVQDMAGNSIENFTDIYNPYEWDITAEVDWIDNNIPDYHVEYSHTGQTNQPVTAAVICPGGTVINNGGLNEHTFYNNGVFIFKVREDSTDLVYEYKAEVTGIDKIPPEITLDGQLVYPLYQGLEFDFVEPGYAASDNLEGDITGKVAVKNNVNVYEGGFYEITYTVSDKAGNVTTVSRSVPVYKISNITLLINGMGIRGEARLNKGDLVFDVVGLRSENFILKYLPGQHKPGSFKGNGIVIENKQLTINEEGWYTFYVMDEEMTMFCGQAYFK